MGWFANLIGRFVDMKLDERGFNDQFLDPLSFDERYRLVEHEVQFKAETAELIYFYKTKRPANEHWVTHLFWRDVVGNLPVQHFPLARIITKAKTNLVFHDSPIFNVLTKNGKPDKKDQKILDECFSENEIINLLRDSSDMRSYSGGVGIVPVIDYSFSQHIIWRAYPRERCHPNFKYGHIDSLIVYDEYSKSEGSKTHKFVLATEYGKGYIAYKLFDEENPSKPKEVSLKELDETSNLKNVIFMENGMPCIKNCFLYVQNNINGESDYQNLIDDFSSLDESYSALTDLIRKGHIKTYIPKSQAVRDPKTGENLTQSDFTDNVSWIPMANPTNAPYKVERDLVALNENEQALVNAFNETLNHALLTTGLSPATIGLDGAGADSSGLALNIRERVSMRTRAEAIGLWQKALTDLVTLTIQLELGNSTTENPDPNSPTSVADRPSTINLGAFTGQVSVQFPEYESPTFDQKVTSLSAALTAGLIDRESALKQLYPDKKDDEIKAMLIAIEGGIPLSQAEIEQSEEKEKLKDGESESDKKDKEEDSDGDSDKDDSEDDSEDDKK